jgi:hypothetical protein
MDPKRVEEAIKKNTAPVLAQIDLLKAKNQLTKENITALKKDNPGLANIKLSGGTTLGEQLDMAAADPDAAKNISNIIHYGLAYDAAKYSADKHLEAARTTAGATNSIKEFEAQTKMYEKANEDIAKWEASPTEAQWTAMDQLQKMNAAARGIVGPRTKAMDDAIRSAKLTRDTIGRKLYGPAYDRLSELEAKVPAAKEIVVTVDDLKNMKSPEGTRALDVFKNLFAPVSDQAMSGYLNNIFSGGPIPASEHPVTRFLNPDRGL